MTGYQDKSLLQRAKALFGGVDKRAEEAARPPDHRATILPAHFTASGSDEDANTHSHFDGGRYGHGRDLPAMLKSSARRNAERQQELQDLAKGVRTSLVERANVDRSLVACALRLFIALLWVVIGVYYYQAQTNAQINGLTTIAGGVPLGDAAQISNTFLKLGGAASLAAMALLFLITMRMQVLKNQIQMKSQNFGLRIAQMLKDYDSRLKQHRDALADKARSDDSVVAEISEAHVTAQEATLLFEDVSFLADMRSGQSADQMDDALASYRDYLDRSGGFINTGLIDGLIVGALFGLLVGQAMGWWMLRQLTNYTVNDVIEKLNLHLVSGFETYPGLLLAIVVGAIGFLLAGLLASSFTAALFGAERKARRRESLNEIRGALTAEEAPRAADIARRVEDLSEIFRVRLMGRPLGAGHAMSAAPDTAPGGRARTADQEDIPPWRRPKEGPRFVETGFQAAPDSWRTDAYAHHAAKKSAHRPGTKRRFFSFKKPLED